MQREPITILLVEDDDVDAEAVYRGFRDRGTPTRIFRAVDGVEAMRMLEQRTIDGPLVVLLDLNMPRMGGIEFLRTLRGHPTLRDTPVVVLTTSSGERDREEARAQGVAFYLTKSEWRKDQPEVFERLETIGREVAFGR